MFCVTLAPKLGAMCNFLPYKPFPQSHPLLSLSLPPSSCSPLPSPPGPSQPPLPVPEGNRAKPTSPRTLPFAKARRSFVFPPGSGARLGLKKSYLSSNMRPIFCGNLDYDARQSEIERLFGKYGRVERVDMKTGFAFVYMEDERDAEDAIDKLDRYDFGRKGRRLRVEWTKEDRSGGRKGNGKRSPSSVKPTKTLFVINFDPINTRTRDLEKHFDQYGKIANIRIRRNFAFVQYESQEDATKALDGTNGSTVMDRVISVEYALRDDDEKRNGYSPDRRGGRDRSPDRRDNRGRSASPYGRGRERGSPDYGRGRERGSPDYGKGGTRDSPDYVRGGSPPYVGKGDARVSPKYDRERSPAYERARSRSPAAREDRD